MSPWQRLPQCNGTTWARRRRSPVQIGGACVVAILASCFPLPAGGQSSRKPDLSSLTSEERNSIESACSYEKLVVGPAAYYGCIHSQLRQFQTLNKTGREKSEASTVSPEFRPESSQSLLAARYPQTSGTSVDLKKLQYFIGTWTLAGDMKTSPFGAGGKFTGTQQNEWAMDSTSMISKWSDKLPAGNDTGKGIFSYDFIQKVYKYHGTSSDGESEDSTGTVEGDTWTWLSNPKGPNGMIMRGRYIQKITSPMSYDFRFEIASQGGGWMTVREGKAEKSH